MGEDTANHRKTDISILMILVLLCMEDARVQVTECIFRYGSELYLRLSRLVFPPEAP